MKTKLIITVFIFAYVTFNTQAKNSNSIYLLVPKGYKTQMQALNCFYKVFYPNEIPENKMNVDYFIFNYSSIDKEYTGIVKNTNSESTILKMNKASLKDAKVRDLKDFFVASKSRKTSEWYGNYYLIDKEDYQNENIEEIIVHSAYTLKKNLSKNNSKDIFSLVIPEDLYQIKINGVLTETYSYFSNNKSFNIKVDTFKNELYFRELNTEVNKYFPPNYKIKLKKEKSNISITINDLYIKTNEALDIKTIKSKNYIVPYKYTKPKNAENIHQEYFVKLDGDRVAKIEFNLTTKQQIRDLLEYKSIDEMQKEKLRDKM